MALRGCSESALPASPASSSLPPPPGGLGGPGRGRVPAVGSHGRLGLGGPGHRRRRPLRRGRRRHAGHRGGGGLGAAGAEEAGAVDFAAEVADGACEVEVVLPVGVRPAVAIYSDHAQATASIRAYRVRGRAPARRAAR